MIAGAVLLHALAVLNEVIWRTQSTDTWVAFKAFGFCRHPCSQRCNIRCCEMRGGRARGLAEHDSVQFLQLTSSGPNHAVAAVSVLSKFAHHAGFADNQEDGMRIIGSQPSCRRPWFAAAILKTAALPAPSAIARPAISRELIGRRSATGAVRRVHQFGSVWARRPSNPHAGRTPALPTRSRTSAAAYSSMRCRDDSPPRRLWSACRPARHLPDPIPGPVAADHHGTP